MLFLKIGAGGIPSPLQDVLQPVPVDSFPGHPGADPSDCEPTNLHDEHPDLMAGNPSMNARDVHVGDQTQSLGEGPF